MKRILCACVLILVVLLTACAQPEIAPAPTSPLKPVTLDNARIVAGQTVYVPIYSSIFMWEQRRSIDLTATLSVRNTDSTNRMIIVAADYYDGDGKLVRRYLEQPVELGTLAATSFVINQDDTTGGAGATFLVKWAAEQTISPPVVESIMINTSGNQGISFVSQGRVIQTEPGKKPG